MTLQPRHSDENLLRQLAPQVLGAVLRRFRNFSAAEDAVQEALLAASIQWPNDGVPDNPRGWLIQVACRRMSDSLRSELAQRRRETVHAIQAPRDEQAAPASDTSDETDQDDTLILLFMCCHPALTSASAIALTLRAVGGLANAEIANAFLVPEATMAQRISRAKQRIKNSGVPFKMPTERERAESQRASRLSATRSRAVRSVHISCRPRSPPFTTKRRVTKTLTGRKSLRYTGCSSASPTPQW